MKKNFILVFLPAVLALLLTVQAFAALPESLIPGGEAIGLEVKTKGVVIVGLSEEIPAAKLAGLKPGDTITRVNGQEILTVSELTDALGLSTTAALTIQREGRELSLYALPVEGKLGVYARDHLLGVGTVSFYEPKSGIYGALGHGINEPASGSLLQIREGRALQVDISSVQKGVCGEPGELKGALQNDYALGTVTDNTPHGIFGSMSYQGTRQELPVAQDWEIETGCAEILSTVSGQENRRYSVQIEALQPWDDGGRNLNLRITDPALLEQTGGIVQGMSGSPIIQNGKLIGAVTHVLVSDPSRGYGIFIRNYLAENDIFRSQERNNAKYRRK